MQKKVMKKPQRKLTFNCKSLTLKLLTWIGVPVLSVFCISALLVQNSVRSSVSQMADDELKIQSQLVANQISEFFTSYITAAQSLSTNLQIQQLLLDSKDASIMKSSEYMSVLYTLVDIRQIDPDNIKSVWVAAANSGQLLKSSGQVRTSGYDISKQSWYQSISNSNKVVLTEPYEDIVSNNFIVSMICPVYHTDTNSLLGVVGLDVTIDNLQTLVSSYKVGKNGFLILTSKDGTIISSPVQEWSGVTMDDAGLPGNLVESISNRSSKIISYKLLEQMNYGYISPVGQTGWAVTTGLPENEYTSAVSSVRFTMEILYGIALILLCTLLIVIARSIVMPLKKLKTSAQKIADGNLDVVVDVRSADEIGQVGVAFSNVVSRLKDYIQYIDEIAFVLEQIAHGNMIFELKCDYSGEFSKIKTSLLHIHSTLSDMLAHIAKAADEVAAGANQLADGSQSLSQSASEQTASVEELTASVTTISQNVEKNAQQANRANHLSDVASKQMEFGSQRMKHLSKAMEEIRESAGQISRILKAMEDIAFQTNILALNAAVEAARAGEAGKGFSVVADEVRSLAAKSAQAAKETSSLIQNSLHAVENGVLAMDETEESFTKAAESVRQTSELMTGIADRAAEQSAAIQQIQQGLNQISATVQTTSATSEQTAASSEELSGQSQQLKLLISKFKIEQ
ncbi:MAG: Methyl-accepting chemotaxis protein McpA [Oscillospiraceae bacterium]|jgi:methyl-accepting chemotaxis protein